MISALYVKNNSVYKTLGLDCWDEERNARLWPGGNPCICHPPCGQWGRLRKLAKVTDQKDLALLAVRQVRSNGGILEHPAHSTLWAVANLPRPGQGTDEYGGFSISIDQHWWGYPAKKNTWLYIVGIKEKDLPPVPMNFEAITHVVDTSLRGQYRTLKYLSKPARDRTVLSLALWLLEIVKTINFGLPETDPALQGCTW